MSPSSSFKKKKGNNYVLCQMGSRLGGEGLSLCGVYKHLIIVLFCTPETNNKKEGGKKGNPVTILPRHHPA